MKIIVSDTKETLGGKAAKHGAQLIREAIAQNGKANIIVATGASQFEVLGHLVKAPDIHWPAVTAFHLDEYIGLPLAHPASFRGYLWQRFVSQLPLPLKAFHYLNGEDDPAAECQRVGGILKQHPVDVAFVGIGERTHGFNDMHARALSCVELDQGEGWFATIQDVRERSR